jgi:hypothetical protein
MAQEDEADAQSPAEEEPELVGYHGTSSVWVATILSGIDPPSGQNYGGESQLGIGFYTTFDLRAAHRFAEVAVQNHRGMPVILEVHARGFARMSKRTVPRRLWWEIPPDSPYITDYDYLVAQVVGYEPSLQRKFNPRAYRALLVR